MKLIPIALGAGAAAFATAASAQESIYAQFGAGVNVATSVRTQTFTYDDGIDDFTGFVRANSKPNLALSLELGVDGLISNWLRLGLSYDHVRMGVDTIDVVGTLNGTPIDISVDPATIGYAPGAVEKGHAFLANAYVNLAAGHPGFDFYVGGGVGIAHIKDLDTGLTAAGTASLEFPLNENWSGGLRYRYLRVSDVSEPAFGVDYRPIQSHLVSLTITGRNR